MDRIITESELRDLIGEVVVGVAGSPDGTVHSVAYGLLA